MRSAILSAAAVLGLGIAAAAPPKSVPTVWSSATAVASPEAVWIPPAEVGGSGWRATFISGASYHLSPCSTCTNQPSFVHIMRDQYGRSLNASISLEFVGGGVQVWMGRHAPHGKSTGFWYLPADIPWNPNGANVLVNDGALGTVTVEPE